ncbi:MAG: hypothetical protein VW405_17535, partial [Rhodospirillaceae bacterium]
DCTGEKLFVPEYRTLKAADMRGGPTPGSAVNPNPLYQLPVAGLFPHLITAPLVGMARGLIETAAGAMRSRVATYDRSKVADLALPQLRLSVAMAAGDAAMALVAANCREADAIAASGGAWDVATKLRWRRDAAYAATRAVHEADMFHQAQGGGAIYNRNPIQRHFRDMHAGLGHIGVANDIHGVAYGRVALGFEPDNAMV